jgi:aminoglycoside phosphotransferase (APT) family kinase protein
VSHSLRSEHGLHSVCAPLPTAAGELSWQFGSTSAALFPFIAGQSLGERGAAHTDAESLGAIFAQLHGIPSEVAAGLPRESFDIKDLEKLKRYLEILATSSPFSSAVRVEVESLLAAHRLFVERVALAIEKLQQSALRASFPLVITHGDAHLWNIISSDRGGLFVIDWDLALLAPLERDIAIFQDCHGGHYETLLQAYWSAGRNGEVAQPPGEDLCNFFVLRRTVRNLVYSLDKLATQVLSHEECRYEVDGITRCFAALARRLAVMNSCPNGLA